MAFVARMETPTSIRFPEKEKKRLLKEAKAEGRTLAGFVRFHLNELIRQRDLITQDRNKK